MPDATLLSVILIIGLALSFDFVNGFHDAANSIATVVSTRVLTPLQGVVWAAVFNFVAAFTFGTAVAHTIGSGLIDINKVDNTVILAGLIGAVVWDLITWQLGLPTSSSHALIGGYAGAAVVKAGFGVLIMSGWLKTLAFIIIAPALGWLLGTIFVTLIYWLFRRRTPASADAFFRRGQLVSAALYSLGHGTNDAQKTMGIIALALVAATKAGTFDQLPPWLSFLRTAETADPKHQHIALWIKVLCALTMAAGTAAGGWRVIKTLGHKLVKLQPVHGFAAETAGASVLIGTAALGMPVSTTHVITSAIMGVGAAKRLNALKWSVAERIVWAWVLTLPISAALAYGLVRFARILGLTV